MNLDIQLYLPHDASRSGVTPETLTRVRDAVQRAAAEALGQELSSVTMYDNVTYSPELSRAVIAAAEDQHDDDDCTVDSDAVISRGDDGVWVSARVHVHYRDITALTGMKRFIAEAQHAGVSSAALRADPGETATLFWRGGRVDTPGRDTLLVLTICDGDGVVLSALEPTPAERAELAVKLANAVPLPSDHLLDMNTWATASFDNDEFRELEDAFARWLTTGELGERR